MDERNDEQPDTGTGPVPRTALDAARDSAQYVPRASDTAPTRIPDGVRLDPPAPPLRRSTAPAPVDDDSVDVGTLGIPSAPASRSAGILPPEPAPTDPGGAVRPVS
ncbi:hypothetical protein NB037_13445, partial [Rathayibacter sp. ZW T2_19]